jgi:hypothetical protein
MAKRDSERDAKVAARPVRPDGRGFRCTKQHPDIHGAHIPGWDILLAPIL